jgi:tetratricopeptide (TPR) repeat protein
MGGIEFLWSLVPGADDAAKLRFVIASAGSLGLVWGVVRWLRKEDLGTTTKTILKTQASAEQHAAAERMELRELVLMLSARIEARFASLPGEAGMSGMAAITRDLQTAVERLAADGQEKALQQLAMGNGEAAMDVFSRMKAANLNKPASEKDEAALARQLGAIALLADENEAMRNYALACALDPDDAEGWTRLGALKTGAGDADGAHRCYTRAMELGKSANRMEIAGEAMSGLGFLANQQGSRAEACEKWKNALEIFRQIGMEAQVAQVESWMREAGCAE